MLEELNHVLMLWEILSFYLPAVAAGVIVAVTLLLVCRDRRRRSLALEAPPESRRIAALAESGLVSPEEARRLLAECNALPEVRAAADYHTVCQDESAIAHLIYEILPSI